jgi:uncharacterized membrane protein YgcG
LQRRGRAIAAGYWGTGSHDLQQVDQSRAIPYAVALGAFATATSLAAFGDDPQKLLPLEVAQAQPAAKSRLDTYPYWLYWGAFHSTVYPPPSHNGSGGGFSGGVGGAASGGGGAGGSL